MNPSVILIHPFTPPDGTSIAQSVNDLFDITYEGALSNFTMSVGTSPTDIGVIRIVNRAINLELSVEVAIPSWLTTRDATSFLIPAAQTRTITCGINEGVALHFARDRQYLTEDNTRIVITPLFQSGLVYVKND